MKSLHTTSYLSITSALYRVYSIVHQDLLSLLLVDTRRFRLVEYAL